MEADTSITSSRLQQLRRYRWAFVFALLLMTVACLLPGDVIGNALSIRFLDKVVHAAAWCIIAFFATNAFVLHRHARWLALALLLWSLGIEYLQQYVPNRSFEWADLIANGVGVVTGVLIARFWRHLPLISSKK